MSVGAVKLCLGTVQFGFKYGISNTVGRPIESEIAAILAHTNQSGIGYLDTAISYGDAETLIGRFLPRDHALRIVTKLPPIYGKTVSRKDKSYLIDSVKSTLDRLKSNRVYGLLIHHAADLAKSGSEAIVEALLELQASGLTERIGASVYDAAELMSVRSRMPINLVQVPFNILDQKLAEQGVFASLKQASIEIHARSVFLQGLLLMQPKDLPIRFAPIQMAMHRLHEGWAARGLKPLEACLGFVLQHTDVDVAVVGVNSLAELKEIEAAYAVAREFRELPPTVRVPSEYLNPARWDAFA